MGRWGVVEREECLRVGGAMVPWHGHAERGVRGVGLPGPGGRGCAGAVAEWESNIGGGHGRCGAGAAGWVARGVGGRAGGGREAGGV